MALYQHRQVTRRDSRASLVAVNAPLIARNMPACEEKDKLIASLDEWANNITNGIVQRSPEWVEARKYTIGGSAAYKLADSMKTLAKEKLGITSFFGCLQTRWGTILEPVIETFTAQDLQCKIVASDSFVLGKVYGTAYSPDGLTVLHINGKWQIVLLEFKCPYSREPIGKIPENYLAQVQYGLDLLNLPTVGLYIETVIRICSWEDLAMNSNHILHGKQEKPSSDKLLSMGILGFYIPAGSNVSQRFQDEFIDTFNAFGDSANDYGIADLSICRTSLISALFNEFESGNVKVFYGRVIMTNGVHAEEERAKHEANGDIWPLCIMDDDIDGFKSFLGKSGHRSIGVLPWKMFYIDYIPVQPRPGMIDEHAGNIRDLIDFLKKHEESPSEVRRNAYYEKYD